MMTKENYIALDEAARVLYGCFCAYEETERTCNDEEINEILKAAYDLGRIASDVLVKEKPIEIILAERNRDIE